MIGFPPSERASTNLLERAREGDQEAWQDLFNDCYPKLVRAVSRRLGGRVRKLCDSTDIANDVMKSLAEKFHHFDFSSINGLHAFLVHAAEQKLIDNHRRLHARKRDLGRDRPLAAGGDDAWQLADRSPTASQLAMASEQEQILLGHQAGEHREVVRLKLQGLSNQDVSRRMGWDLRRVQRCLERLRGACRL